MTSPTRQIGGAVEPFMPTVTIPPDMCVIIAGGERVTWAECQRRLHLPLIPASDLEQITRERDEAVGLLRRWHSVDYPSEALDDITDAFLATVEGETDA